LKKKKKKRKKRSSKHGKTHTNVWYEVVRVGGGGERASQHPTDKRHGAALGSRRSVVLSARKGLFQDKGKKKK
jgi:hypothetical protein